MWVMEYILLAIIFSMSKVQKILHEYYQIRLLLLDREELKDS